MTLVLRTQFPWPQSGMIIATPILPSKGRSIKFRALSSPLFLPLLKSILGGKFLIIHITKALTACTFCFIPKSEDSVLLSYTLSPLSTMYSLLEPDLPSSSSLTFSSQTFLQGHTVFSLTKH